ncbi:MAG: 2-oxo-4-hydroxy-4-carboxy-5-ureidoimidazoline decarboxylase [Isosphaerales bacterium]
MNLEHINAWPEDEARESFERCCGSTRWCRRMARRRPFASEAALFEAALQIWWGLARVDWLEAFAAHPKIGDMDALRTRFATTADWAALEQRGSLGAPEEVLRELAEGNRRYEERFGHIFIVFATGKTAHEMLSLLGRRLANDAEDEIRIAAAEQAKITRLRLERIVPLERIAP